MPEFVMPGLFSHALPKFVMAGLVPDKPGHDGKYGRDIGAKQSFVASPGHDGGLTLCSVERP